MMLNTQTFIPRYFQLKLHANAQISSGAPEPPEQFTHVESSSCGDDSIFLAVQMIEESYLGNKQYGFLAYCS